MNESDKAKFQALFNGAYRAQGRTTMMATEGLNMVFAALSAYPINLIEYAVAAAIGESSDVPTVSSIKKVIDGGSVSADHVLASARSKTTPLGILCNIQIGSHDLKTATDMFYLRSRAQECIDKLPEWREKARTGNYTDNELASMVRNKVDPRLSLEGGPNVRVHTESLDHIITKARGTSIYKALEAPEVDPMPDVKADTGRVRKIIEALFND